jgi:hypothetical protein
MEPVATLLSKPLGAEAADDHRRLAGAITAVEEILDHRPDAAWLQSMRPRLDTLSDTVQAHFQSEGNSELYRQLPIEHPRFAVRLAELEHEHEVILDLTRATLDMSGKLKDDPELYELREFDARIQWLIAFLRRHEAEETEIVMRAYWEEVGTGD